MVNYVLYKNKWSSFSSQNISGGSYGGFVTLRRAANENTTLKFREGTTDNYGFTLEYNGAGTNNFKVIRNSNSSVGNDVITIDRDTGVIDVDSTIISNSISSQAISGGSIKGKISGSSFTLPLYPNLTAAGAASTRPGQLIRTSGNSNGTWVWMSLYGGSSYQWMQLTYLSGV